MAAEDIWALFIVSYGRSDIPEHVRRDIGGAAKRLFSTRYRRFHRKRMAITNPDAWRKYQARNVERARRWAERNPEKRAAYSARWKERHPHYFRDWYERLGSSYWQEWYQAHAEQERARSRARYWRDRGLDRGDRPNRLPRPPRLSPEEVKERNREAVIRYRTAHRSEIAERERIRRRKQP